MLHAESLPRIIQGANGSLIMERYPELCREIENIDALNLSHRDLVEKIHLEYINAGADILVTNTFLSSPLYSSRWRESLAEGIKAAASARDKSGKSDIEIAVSLAPVPLEIPEEEARRIYSGQIAEAARFSPCTLLFETLTIPQRAFTAMEAAKDFPNMKVWISFCPKAAMLEEMKEAAGCLSESGKIDRLGINCLYPVTEAIEAARALASASVLPIRLRPAVSMPGCETITPEESARSLVAAVEKIPHLEGVGYCCGSNPHYISLLTKELNLKNDIYHA